MGEQVAKVILRNASKMKEYHLWWDGRTTTLSGVPWESLKTHTDDNIDNGNARIMQGDKMCRNGRYFVVLTIKDFSGKEKNYMKQVVLIK